MRRISGLDTGLNILLEKAPGPEFDYGFVMDCLKSYSNPRVKLSHLIKIKALIRVKKGIYVFGKNHAKSPYSPEVLANMISGPSYVSLEWACQYHRLIPEKVTSITSVTTLRSKQFNTPVGVFTYDHIPLSAYATGIQIVELTDKRFALIATKEKALVDLLILRRGSIKSKKHFKETVLEDFRIEESDLSQLDLPLLRAIYKAHPHRTTHLLVQLRESYE